jgi:hypothetical protein
MNLSFLMTIQAGIRQDPVAACYKYRLTAQQAPSIANLPPDQIHTIIANLGHESLFTPRQDLLQLLEAPPGLLIPLSAVRESHPHDHSSAPVERRITKKA